METEDKNDVFRNEELPGIIMETSKYIKPDKLEDWKKICLSNCSDSLGILMVKMLADMIKSVANGKSFDEMDKEICCDKYGTSGFAMGYAVNVLSEVATFGDDIRVWWNRQWGISDDETKTVNPAVAHISN